ncbi:hypothetical protein PCE31107_03331 [Pandoraea cepalis]|uniref:Uncharacterized protein n=1 Tax=Pandoraea cepalis TaxID=2508294 RepID=A0A5E4WNF1_9BURK|nr:hypothetical protein PCE31107_03331 [Pandoraea cepalis]
MDYFNEGHSRDATPPPAMYGVQEDKQRILRAAVPSMAKFRQVSDVAQKSIFAFRLTMRGSAGLM